MCGVPIRRSFRQDAPRRNLYDACLFYYHRRIIYPQLTLSIYRSLSRSVCIHLSIYLSTHLSISMYSSTCLSFLTFFLIINLFYSCFSLPAPVSLPLSFHNPVCIYVCFYMRAPPIFLAAFITSRVLFCPCGLVSLPYHYHRTVPCHANHYGCLRHSRRSPPYPSPARLSCAQAMGILHLAVWIVV